MGPRSAEHSQKGASAHRGAPKWLEFVLLLVVLGIIAWLVLPVFTHTGSSSLAGIGDSNATLAIGLKGAPQSLDVRSADNPAADRILIGNVYEGLTGRTNDNKVAPALASGWTVSNGGTTYTFTLRNADFSNGDAVTAQDVAWSFQQLLAHKYPGYEQLSGLSSVRTPDSTTVVLTLLHPDQQLLWELGGRAGLVFDEKSGDTGSDVPGTGPYTVANYADNDVTLRRNDYYWGVNPHFKTVTFDYFADSAAETAALKAGKIQGAIDLDAADAASLKSSGKYTVTSGTTTTVATLVFNANPDSLMSDYQAREAMRLMISRPQVVAAAGGLGTPLGGPITSLDPGYQDLNAQFPTDVRLGREKFDYYYTRAYTLAYTDAVPQAVADSVVSQIEAAGWKVTPYRISGEQWNTDVVQSMRYDMVLYLHHGSHDLGYWTTGRNWWGFDSPVADQQYTAAIRSTSESAYEQGLRAAALTLASKQPADWLYQVDVESAWDSGLTGMPTNMTDDWLPLGSLR